MAVRVRVPLAALSPLNFSSMKKFAYIIFLFATLFLTSCGVGSGHFKFEGKFLNMNQGEFYVYSPDGGINGLDTIRVVGGRFTYECDCKNPFTLMVVFPNFSEQPIFAESGASVDIKADASHLKELSVKGTKANEQMNQFRENILKLSPPEEKAKVEQFIKDHPESIVSTYLIRKYFVNTSQPDYAKAYTLTTKMAEAQPQNGSLQKMLQQLKQLKTIDTGSRLPQFTAYDIQGKMVSSTTLLSAPVAVISTWASYNYDSQDLLRELKKRMQDSKGRLKLMSICIDPSTTDCKRNLTRDSISWPNICTGDMLEDKTLQKLGMTAVPDVIVLQNGKIVARGLKREELKRKLDQLLK